MEYDDFNRGCQLCPLCPPGTDTGKKEWAGWFQVTRHIESMHKDCNIDPYLALRKTKKAEYATNGRIKAALGNPTLATTGSAPSSARSKRSSGDVLTDPPRRPGEHRLQSTAQSISSFPVGTSGNPRLASDIARKHLTSHATTSPLLVQPLEALCSMTCCHTSISPPCPGPPAATALCFSATVSLSWMDKW